MVEIGVGREENVVTSSLPVKLTEDVEEGREGKRARGRVEERGIPDLSKGVSIRCLKMGIKKSKMQRLCRDTFWVPV